MLLSGLCIQWAKPQSSDPVCETQGFVRSPKLMLCGFCVDSKRSYKQWIPHQALVEHHYCLIEALKPDEVLLQRQDATRDRCDTEGFNLRVRVWGRSRRGVEKKDCKTDGACICKLSTTAAANPA